MNYKDINIDEMKMPGKRILVRKEKPVNDDGIDKRESGIYVPKDMDVGDKDPGNIVEVVKVGPEVYIPGLDVLNPDSGIEWAKGCAHPIFLIQQPFTGFAFKHGDYDYTIISEQDVLSVL